MTPEQMAALAKQQCIFCQIASGKVASRKIYEDEKVVGVLDINPANPGHVLLITKEHYVVMPQIPDDVVAHIGMVAKGISHALLRALKAQGTTIFAANGVAAGQRAQHFMLHIIPRMENDGIGIEPPEHKISAADYKKILKALKPGIAKAFGQRVEEEPEEKVEKAEETGAEVKKETEKEDAEEEHEEKKVVEAEEVPEEEPEEEEPEEEEPEEEVEKAEDEVTEGEEETEADVVEAEEVTLEEAAKGEKKKKAKKPKKTKKKEKEEPEEEPEEEIDEERQKLDQIAGLMTGQ